MAIDPAGKKGTNPQVGGGFFDSAPHAPPTGALKQPGVIGKGISIRGKVQGKEDLRIEGTIEGEIILAEHHLILEKTAVVRANVEAENITIRGAMHGNSVAMSRVEITEEAKVMGDIKAPRLLMREGARFRGFVEMDVPLPKDLRDAQETKGSLGATFHESSYKL